MKTCKPTSCGKVPKIGKSTHLRKEIFFPGQQRAVCSNGYSTDGTKGGNKKTFLINCNADGSITTDPALPEAPGMSLGSCIPIKCPAARVPTVANGDMTNFKPQLVFGDSVNYMCKTGYSPSGQYSAAAEDNAFDVECLATGEWPEEPDVPKCLPNTCGESPMVDFSEKSPDSGIGAYKQPAGTVLYTCKEGYEKIPKDAAKPRRFTATCNAEGEWDNVLVCEPVVCGVPPNRPLTMSSPMTTTSLVFPQRAEYECLPGYSLDGKPSGQRKFEEECLKDAQFDQTKDCSDIDWCIKYQTACGEGNTCIDKLHTYECECKEGFVADTSDEGLPMCREILECDTQEGSSNCKPYGRCAERIGSYVCECEHGYEVEAMDDGRETCVPKICGAPETQEFAIAQMVGKVSFPTEVPYKCEVGYSLDGTPSGGEDFSVACEDDGRFGKPKTADDPKAACEPIECKEIPRVANSDDQDTSKFVFPETRTIKCKKGFTITGEATSDKEFTIDCLSTGEVSAVDPCLRVSCGASSPVSRSLFENKEYFFEDKVLYTCEPGYTVTGLAGGKTEFEIECKADGTFDDPESCNPVQCGVPPPIPNGLRPGEIIKYPRQANAQCKAGYAVAGAAGDVTFTLTCDADGNFQGLQSCDPVSCGLPPEGVNALPVQPDREYFYLEAASYSCKPGFSTQGLPTDPKDFQKACAANGNYVNSEPSDCLDIDYCYGNPCGFNGDCTDGETGYTCACSQGYELMDGPNGPTCTEDDCAGHDCGEGGACIDLSEKATGAYACECESGYETFTRKDGEILCERVSCGESLELPQTTVKFKGYQDEAFADIEVPKEMKYDDVVEYTCSEGYSTDGTNSAEAVSFSARCTETGDTTALAVCTKIKCDNYQLPAVPNSNAHGVKESFFEFGDVVRFQCKTGYTLTGRAGGGVDFSVKCQASGNFEDPQNCEPVKCEDPPEVVHGEMSPTNKIQYPEDVIYRCESGYETETGATVFQMSCFADGKYDKMYGDTRPSSLVAELIDIPQCLPVKCGVPPEIPHATFECKNAVSGDVIDLPIAAEVNYDQVLDYRCDEGYTLNGRESGLTEWTVGCDHQKQFQDAEKTCSIIEYKVEGIVGDASSRASGGSPIANADVKFGDQSVKTDLSGRYELWLPNGEYELKVTALGFIKNQRKVKVQGDTLFNPAMSGELPDTDWRAVVRWTDNSDIDAKLWFGVEDSCKANYKKQKTAQCPKSGGIVGMHENDSTEKGPETVRINNIGNCDAMFGGCGVKLKIVDSGGSGLATSGVMVTLYNGKQEVQKFKWPEGGDEKRWTVFTLDAQTDAETVLLPGEAKLCPYITDVGEADWAETLENEGWATLPEAALATGFWRADGEALKNLDVASYALIQDTEGFDCMEESWAQAFNRPGKVACDEGYFVAGLYRSGNTVRSEKGDAGIHQIDIAKCCKPKETPKKWNACTTQSWNFKQTGWAKCPEGTFVAGLERSNEKGLSGIVKAKCCAYPTKGGCQ
jgi:hypothetical protein